MNTHIMSTLHVCMYDIYIYTIRTYDNYILYMIDIRYIYQSCHLHLQLPTQLLKSRNIFQLTSHDLQPEAERKLYLPVHVVRALEVHPTWGPCDFRWSWWLMIRGPTEEGDEEPPMCPVGTWVGLSWAAVVSWSEGMKHPYHPRKATRHRVRCHNYHFGIRNVADPLRNLYSLLFLTGSFPSIWPKRWFLDGPVGGRWRMIRRRPCRRVFVVRGRGGWEPGEP